MRLTRAEQRLRRRARARTLQALYAWDVGRDGSLADAVTRTWDDLSLGAEERAFAAPLVQVLCDGAPALDDALTAITTNWRLERLGAIERAVLRLAGAELQLGETPSRVVLKEAIYLAERFGSPESARFVNGVLDALARRLGRI
jgi:transcription antitermination protein NusB